MTRFTRLAAALAPPLLAVVILNTMSAEEPGNGRPFSPEDRRIRAGFEMAPVPLNLEGRERGLVGLGSYLVNAVGGCADCHSCPTYSSNPYAGGTGALNTATYLAGGVPFGPFTSRNITPKSDEGNRPAGLTFEQFVRVFRTGIDPDNEHPQISPLLQVMPWPQYRKMNDRDLRAIYEYLSAIPHAEMPPPGTCSTAGE